VSWRTLARNAVLAVVALAVLLADLGSPPPSLFDAVSTLRGAALVAWTVGLAAVAIIGLGAWAFVHLLRAHGRLLLRVEHLEQQLVHAGLADALGDLTGEAEGLPPGSPVPVMTADDIEGGPADWKDLLDRSRSLLLLFTSPQCAPCRELRPEIRAWQQRLGSQLRFGLASDGRVEEIRREAVEFGVTDPLVDRDLRLFHARAPYSCEVTEQSAATWPAGRLLFGLCSLARPRRMTPDLPRHPRSPLRPARRCRS
jgi:hypothetical protein